MKSNFLRQLGMVAGICILLLLCAYPAFAGSATWNLNPSSDWNTAGNWTPATVPNGPSDTATFDLTNNATVSLSANTEVNGITFNATASAYTITVTPGIPRLAIDGSIINNSAVAQNFVMQPGQGALAFRFSATAGTNIVYTNNGGTASGQGGGFTQFLSNSSADHATFINNGATVADAFSGGFTQFEDTTSAANGTFINNPGTVSGAPSGATSFDTFATAGNGMFTNNGGAVSGALGGSILFHTGTPTGGNGTFINNGGTASGGLGGTIDFRDTSTAGSATITNEGSAVSGAGSGVTAFYDTSTAGSATITNNGATVSGAFGGNLDFEDTSTAGSATITNRSSSVGGYAQTSFDSNSTAGNAIITNDGLASSGAIGGRTQFDDSSNGGSATITNDGGTAAGAGGGLTQFDNTTSASSATITSNGGTVAGANGGETEVIDLATAGSATLIANGGTGGGNGGEILFFDNATGGTARVEVFDNGELDISPHNSPGVTIGSLEGSGNVFLGANNLSVGSNNMSTTFSGVIQDGGSSGGTGGALTKIGTGALILSHNNTFTGGLTLEDGILGVGSLFALGAGNVTVNGGVLETSGGHATFVVGNNYMQTSGGTLQIGIGRFSGLLSSDTLEANGTASLGGTLQLIRLNNYVPMSGDQVIILTANGGVSNEFATVDSNFPGLLQPHVIYDPNDVMVEFLLSSFNIGGLTPNQKSVAHNLDNAASDPAAAPLINFLVLEALGSLPHDYDLIAPEELASIYEIGFSQAVVQNDNLQRRMDDIRAGSNGFCADGFVPQVSGKDYSKDSDGKGSLPDKSTRDVYTPAPDNRWGVFVTGTGDFVNVGNDDSNAPGYDITTGDVTVGADYRLCNNFAIGIDAGYSRSTADLVDDGRVDVDGGKVGAYATVFGKGLFGSKFYVDGAVGGGFNSYDTRRTGLQDEPVSGNTDGSEFNAMISYGSDWTFGCLTIGTWSSVQYTNVSIDQFTETGSLAPLIIEDQDENSFRTTTGLHASYDIKAGHFIFRPEVRVAYQHEYCDQAYQVDSQLASGAGTVFRVRGPDIGRDAALAGTGMSMQWNNRLSTYVYYDGVLGRNNYDNNAVSGGFRIGF